MTRVESMENTTQAINHPAKNNTKIKRVMLLLIVVIMTSAGIWYYLWIRNRVSTDDAFITGHIHQVSSRVPGFIDQVLVADNERVRQGQVLVKLDDRDYRVAVEAAEAALEEAGANWASARISVPLTLTQTEAKVGGARAGEQALIKSLRELDESIKSAHHQSDRAKALYNQAKLDYDRMSTLYKKQVVPKRQWDEAESQYRAADAAMKSAQAQAEAMTRKIMTIKEEIHQARAQVDLAGTGKTEAEGRVHTAKALEAKTKGAEAALEQARLNLGYTEIKAPADGFITQKSAEVGNMIKAGQPLLAIVPLHNIWVVANYKETQLAGVKVGQRVILEVDGRPEITLNGKVDSIMAGTGAAFSLFPPENATGNYVKIVQRVPVKIIFDPKPDQITALRVGMSVVPTILTGSKN
ncbi:MAG: HlyD family secretion protein [Deltaproteobacteria bacterium]|nr:HlyD family secretion protein [Deltaproteobacteria bacterium]